MYEDTVLCLYPSASETVSYPSTDVFFCWLNSLRPRICDAVAPKYHLWLPRLRLSWMSPLHVPMVLPEAETEPPKPSALRFRVMMLIIPASPSARYKTDGDAGIINIINGFRRNLLQGLCALKHAGLSVHIHQES